MNSPDATTMFRYYSASVFICAQILSLIEATALKRFVVHSAQSNSTTLEQSGSKGFVIWVFNPDLYYSCSAYDGSGLLSGVPQHAEAALNPHNHDVSQLYHQGEIETPQSQYSSPTRTEDRAAKEAEDSDIAIGDVKELPSRNRPIVAEHKNPHHDDVSQIYGESSGPLLMTGDLEFEVPISNPRSKTSTDSSLPYAEPITDTETPLISAKSATNSKSDDKPQTYPQVNRDTTTEHVNLVHRAAKIFYKPLPTCETPASFLDANSTTHEELHLSSNAELEELYDTLEKSNSMLPASAKAFQEWKIGLLNRYEKVPSGLGVMQENPLARGVNAKDGRVTRWSIGDGAEGLYA